jgi:1-acyl-sn-glycerol-3-phosphate acyltransferase
MLHLLTFCTWAVVMNLFVYPATVLWTLCGIVLFPFAFPLWKICTGRDGGHIMRDFVWIYGRVWMLFVFPFAPIRMEGINLRKWRGKPCILVMNHFSFLDTYCMGALPFSNVVFAVRAWPFKLLWYRPFMRLAEYFNMEELGWEGCLSASRKIFSQGAALLFFPEGHRSKDGKMQRFYSGPFKLSIETGVPIIPLCISGTDVLLPPHRSYLLPARIQLIALPPVDPRGFTGVRGHIELKEHVKKVMTEALKEMGKAHHQQPVIGQQ